MRNIGNYLIVGVLNTVLGYFIGVAIYYVLKDNISNMIIALIINSITILIAFANYKIFHFKTNNNTRIELLKFYVSYGFVALINIILFDCLLKNNFNIWQTQTLLIVTSFVVTYFVNTRIVFKR